MRLKSRVKTIPHGFRFTQPEVNWNSVNVVGKAPSWEAIVTAVVAMRNANPHAREKHQWATDVETVANEVDAYNAKICHDNGWGNYLMAAGYSTSLPPVARISEDKAKELGANAEKARKIWSSVKALSTWLDSGNPPVEHEQYLSRARTCVDCPLNGQGDFTKFFTIPATESIQRQLGRMKQHGFEGELDDKLGICEACLSPLAIKTKTPIQFLKPQMDDGTIDALRKGKDCWVLKELG